MQEDILFKNRNKEYGAWILRKKYQKSVWIGLLISSFLFLLLFLSPLLFQLKKAYLNPVEIPKVAVSAELAEIHIEPPKEEVPPPKAKVEKPRIQEEPKIEPPKDTVAKNEAEKDTLEKKEEKIAEVPENPRLKEAGIFSCQEGIKDFRNWFLQNFAIPESISHTKVEIRFTIKFSVNKQGFVDQVKTLEEVNPLIFTSVEKVLINSPRWQECIYKGQSVRQEYTLPVFILSSKSLIEGNYLKQ